MRRCAGRSFSAVITSFDSGTRPMGSSIDRDVVQIVVGSTSSAMRDLLAEFRVAGIDDDAIQPRLEARAGHQGVPELPRPQERLLHGVFGVGSIAQDQVRGAHGTGVAVLEPGPQFVDVDRVTHLRDLPTTSRSPHICAQV